MSTIWIVDDSATQRLFIEKALGPRFRYEQFVDGASVIARMAQTTPDLILLDWVMPGASGDEVCRHLRRTGATTPIIILTASQTASDDLVLALRSGANDYVTKPFVVAELQARVDNVLRAEREHRRVIAMNRLAVALLHAGSVAGVLDAIAGWLVPDLADACAISVVEDGVRREVALGTASGPHEQHKTIDIRAGARLEVMLRRESAFDPRDLMMLDACVDYSALAIEAALRSERELATTKLHEEMIGIVGHDLRGPLTSFGLGLELVNEPLDDQTRAATVGRLRRSTARMNKIVDLLLDVTRSRIGNGIPIDARRISLRDVVSTVLDEVRVAHGAVRFELLGSDAHGDWDGDRLQQVVGNLANNAAQYGHAEQPVTFEIATRDDVAELVVRNANRGAPIAETLRASIFDPFRRGQTRSNTAGLGLGLYIVHQIVRAHGGTVDVTSDHTGTAFRVSLPVTMKAMDS